MDAVTERCKAERDALVVGAVVECEGRLWRVGLVNFTRARLDPITGTVVAPSPASGRCFISYGGSINVCPTSPLRRVDSATLDEAATKRAARLAASEVETALPKQRHSEDEEDEMAEETMAVSGAPVPARADRRAVNARKLAKAPKNSARKMGAPKPKKARAAAAPKELKPCACGCGEKTAGYFVPGHDSKFKSWLLKIERGVHALHGRELANGQERTPMPRKVQESYKWVKRGDGWIPTTNYKGEAHSGYDK